MERAFDRLATAASMRIVAWIRARIDESNLEWASAFSAELATIDGPWKKLAWAIGGLPLAWSFSRKRKSLPDSTHFAGALMSGQMPVSSRSGLEAFVLNVVSLVAWWLLLFLWIRTQFPLGLQDWRAGDLTILGACILGVPAALTIRRTGAGYVLAGFVAYGVIEFAFHSIFGHGRVQGGPAHFSDMAAGILGVTFAALAESLAAGYPSEAIWEANKIGTSLLCAGFAIRRSLGAWSPIAFGVIAFAITEAAARVFFGWIYFINGRGWRLRHIFLDGKTNYAILLCALLGAALGTGIAKWGDRIALRFPNRKQSPRIAAS